MTRAIRHHVFQVVVDRCWRVKIGLIDSRAAGKDRSIPFESAWWWESLLAREDHFFLEVPFSSVGFNSWAKRHIPGYTAVSTVPGLSGGESIRAIDHGRLTDMASTRRVGPYGIQRQWHSRSLKGGRSSQVHGLGEWIGALE